MATEYSGGLELTWTNKDKALLSTGDGKYDYTFVDRADYRVSEVRLLHEVERMQRGLQKVDPTAYPSPRSTTSSSPGTLHVLDVLNKVPEYAERYLKQGEVGLHRPSVQHGSGVR